MRTLLAFLALSSAAAAQVTVTGKVYYEDRMYDIVTGLTGSVNRSVRQAKIELLDAAGNLVLVSGVTNETGDYSLSFAGPQQDARIRVYAQRSNGKINAVVRNNPGSNQIYAVLGPVFNTMTKPIFDDLIITQGGGAGGAFNIFDCAVKSFQYLASPEIEPTLADVPPLLTIYWEAGSLDGTYFDSGVPAIFLLGGSNDPDEYDDDIILHEIGHWVATYFSQDDTPGGQHSILDQLDPRLSWSEGWAHYWSAVVRIYANTHGVFEYPAPNLQIDTHSGPPSWFDVEGPSFPGSAIWATNELAVVAVLWDLVDPGNEAFDSLGGLETEIWTSVSVHIKNMSNITLEDFHAGLALQPLVDMSNISGGPSTVRIFNHRLIRYYADPSEANESAVGSPTLSGVLTSRTIYPAGDLDWFTVVADPGTLVVETLNLGDGADTLLQLYDSTGTTLLTSNNNRSATDKSSRLQWGVSATTTFRVHVLQVSPIVEHGSYDLQVQTLPASGGGRKHKGCGLTGGEAFLLLALLRGARRRR